MALPQNNTLFEIKPETTKQQPNLDNLDHAVIKSQIGISLSWKKFILHQIDKTAPIIAKNLSSYLIPVIEQIGAKILNNLDYLSELKALQKAYENQWILSTSQLSRLLKVDAQILLRYKRFEQHGFVFFRNGKVLSEIGWSVGKSSSGYDDDY